MQEALNYRQPKQTRGSSYGGRTADFDIAVNDAIDDDLAYAQLRWVQYKGSNNADSVTGI
jgi:hypothetical protein